MSEPENRRTAVVIGGGVGGLAAAIRLQRAGVAVRLFERAATVGGKLREVGLGGKRLPGGPSVFTMRGVFEELFDGKLDAWLELLPLDPLCRHFFPDGSVLDLYSDEEKSAAAIEAFAGQANADGYRRFRKHAARIYEVVRGPFMENPVPSWAEFLRPRILMQMPRIDALRTLWTALEDMFPDPRLRQLFGRYATYNGSSPYHAPATLAVIAHVENADGIFAPRGGIYRLAEALLGQARALGVEVVCNADVTEVLLEGKQRRAVGIRLSDGRVERADLVIANCDVAHLYGLLGEAGEKPARKYAREDLSLSACLLLCVADKAPLALAHHNVFFSPDYPREFSELVDERRPPSDPTVYLCAEDVHEQGPQGYFFLANAPALQKQGADRDWATEGPALRTRMLAVLERYGWKLQPTCEELVPPTEFARLFPSSKGALYGLASNSRMAAFKRPPNQVPHTERLYAVGGTVHPGAGLPMTCLSARIAVTLALAELGVERIS